ncbi:MAG TPA: alpha/beta fold hydrolase [Xanthobacteraceae bacterium]|nr:alpha/beta fold hydrolase [Xanthobacteraceae bacterium]
MNERAKNERPIARRTLLKSAGFGIGAGLGTTLVSGIAPARADSAPAGDIWSHDYWAQKGDVKLYLFRKRVGAPNPSAPPLPVLFLVHGSSMSARSSYDLQVPGTNYSLMDVFARYGFDVWTMDHEGYGRSAMTQSNSDIMSGVADLKAAVPVIGKETGRTKFHLFGESSGSIRAAAFAQAMPERVDRLILAASTYKGEGAAEIQRRRDKLVELRATPRRKRDASMIRSIFSRDGHPGIYDPAMVDALVAAEMPFGDTIPAGTYIDMAANLPLVDPTKIQSPVLMTRGEWDGNSTDTDLLDFFRQLPTGDRQYVILPNTAHSQGFSKNREVMWYVMKNFLTEPPALAS